ncbi:hypothetical protein CVT24_006408, partial [Panaeolus cyanescens]
MHFTVVSTIFIVTLPIFTRGVPVSIGQQDGPIVGHNELTSAKLKIVKAEHPTGEHIVVVKDITHLGDVMKLVPDNMRESLSKLEDINGFAGKFTPEVLDKFLSNPNVKRVSEDGYMDYDTVTEQSNAPWNLVRLNVKGPVTNTTPHVYKYDPSAGSCADVYVIDSGINIHHDEFKHGTATRAHWGTTIGTYAPGTENTDPDGHGTGMAGIIAGKTHGVAKLANVYAVKIGGRRDAPPTDPSRATGRKAIQGVEWARKRAVRDENSQRRSIISMSIGMGASLDLDEAVLKAIAHGVHVVASAGNGAKIPGQDVKVGIDASTRSPGRVQSVITVGALTQSNHRLTWSNFGE